MIHHSTSDFRDLPCNHRFVVLFCLLYFFKSVVHVNVFTVHSVHSFRIPGSGLVAGVVMVLVLVFFFAMQNFQVEAHGIWHILEFV